MMVPTKKDHWPEFKESGENWSQELLNYGKHLHQAEMRRLEMLHRGGATGREIVQSRAGVLDHLVKQIHVFLLHREKGEHPSGGRESAGLAILAIGGYGRGELAPFSDVDLMFLVSHRPTPKENRRIQNVLSHLWDMGLEIGHSVRTIKGALEMGGADLVSLVSMLDARFLAGEEGLFRDFNGKLQSFLAKNLHANGKKLLESIRDRHLKQGGTAFIQEPNLKEAKGGLRDFHSAGWIARLVFPKLQLEKAIALAGIQGLEWKEANAAYDFLLRLRNEVHFLAQRHQDDFTYDLVSKVIPLFKFKRQPFQKEAESFLNYYYQQARHISFVLEILWDKAARELDLGRKWTHFKLLRRTSESARQIRKLLEEYRIAPSPQKALALFGCSQDHPELFNEEARHSIRTSIPQFAAAQWSTAGVHDVFIRILQQRGRVGSIVRSMHENGLLGKLLPEFGRLTCLVEHDRYHKYTTDEHTLRALESLDQIACGQLPQEVPYQKLLEQIEDPTCLYLAVLFHDVGKGLGGNHSVKGAKLARQALSRLGFKEEEKEAVEFLVEHHLLLSHVSQRRDLEDPHTVEEVVDTVKRMDYLNMLLLLTYADLASIGPEIWTEWKDYLLWQLYYKVYERLMFRRARNPESRQELEPIRRKLAQLLENEVDAAALSRHLELLPERYVLYTPPDQIRRHLELIGQLQQDEILFDWVDHPEKRYCDLLVVTRDRPGLFARIAGGLATFNLSILSAQLNTRKDKLVCDVFQVSSRARQGRLHPEDFPRIEKFLRRAAAGQVNLEEHLSNSLRASGASHHGHFPPRVQTDNSISPTATVIEIQAEDMVGLGYRIASVLVELGLNIVFAKLATEKAQALDIFYVQDRQGRKVHDPHLLREMVEKVQEVLAAPTR